MENFNLLLLHAIMWRRGLRRKTWCLTVHQINIKKLEFEICCPSPVQLVRNVVSVSVFTTTGIVYCLVALNWKNDLSHIHFLTQNSRRARSMVSDWWKWNRTAGMTCAMRHEHSNSATLVGLDSTRVYAIPHAAIPLASLRVWTRLCCWVRTHWTASDGRTHGTDTNFSSPYYLRMWRCWKHCSEFPFPDYGTRIFFRPSDAYWRVIGKYVVLSQYSGLNMSQRVIGLNLP